MENDINDINNKNINLFYVSYILILICEMFSNVTFLSQILNYCDYLAIIILLIHVVQSVRFFSTKEVIKIAILLILAVIITMVSGDKKILKLSLFLVSFKGENFKKFIKMDFKLKIILTLTIISFYFLGLTGESDVYRKDGTMRYALGFQHPNNLSAITISIFLDYIYLETKGIYKYILLALIFFINYFVADSRAGAIILIIAFIYILIPKKITDNIIKNKIMKVMNINLLPVFLILSLYLSSHYILGGEDLINKIDKLLSGRIYMGYYYLQRYEAFSLFGHDMINTSKYINGIINTSYLALDNAYMYLLLRFGTIFTTLFIGGYIYIIYKAYKEKKYTLICVLILWLIYGLMESTFISVNYNPFLLILVCCIYTNNSNNKEGEKINNVTS